MLFEPFEAPKLKLERARYHIGELDRNVFTFLGRRPFRAVIEADSTPGRLRLTYRVSEPVPKILSAMIGDAIHNLHAALDLMACDLVRLNNQSDEGVYFPFCGDATHLDQTIKKRHLDRAAPNVVTKIKSLKPYKGGNVQLRAIHDLDIMDKHQAIIPLGDCAAFDELPPETGIVVTPSGHFGPVQDGFAPFAFPAAPSLPVGREIPATFILTFAPLATALGPREVVPTLRSLADLVADIIESFETLCLQKGSV